MTVWDLLFFFFFSLYFYFFKLIGHSKNVPLTWIWGLVPQNFKFCFKKAYTIIIGTQRRFPLLTKESCIWPSVHLSYFAILLTKVRQKGMDSKHKAFSFCYHFQIGVSELLDFLCALCARLTIFCVMPPLSKQ